MAREGEIDIGLEHYIRYFSWAPHRDLNPQYADLPDLLHAGIIMRHVKVDGSDCEAALFFDNEVTQRQWPRWSVEATEPLTLSPSVLCDCGDHGFIRSGRWVPA